MKKDNTHKINKLNTLLDVGYDESKEDIWLVMQDKINEPAKVIPLKRRTIIPKLAIAASIMIFFGLSAFIRFYSESFETEKGIQQNVELPDGSIAQLNGSSSLKYHPYWWKISRNVVFEGEAFFEVAKGSKFKVESTKGNTTVLGTSFNIYARSENYEVVCVTGKVWVQNSSGKISTILTPNKKAVLDQAQFTITDNNTKESIGWINNNFYFTSDDIHRVFSEISIAYGINIEIAFNEKMNYSGNFSRTESIEDVLNLVCKPLNLNFVKNNANSYLIVSK